MLALVTHRGRALPWASSAAASVMAPLPPAIAPRPPADAAPASPLDDGDIRAIMADPRSPLATIAAAVAHPPVLRATSL
jgi:hypothetical protein